MEEQQKKSTAEVLVECLKEEGVDTIFGIPGEETLDLTTMFAPITKRTKQIIRPDTVAEITQLAFKYASEALTEFVNKLHIPVVNTMMAKGIVSMDNPYSLWTLGIPQKDYVNKIFEVADLVIGVAMTWWNVRRPSGTSAPAPKSYILPVSLPMSINVISRMWSWWAIFPTACRKF